MEVTVTAFCMMFSQARGGRCERSWTLPSAGSCRVAAPLAVGWKWHLGADFQAQGKLPSLSLLSGSEACRF